MKMLLMTVMILCIPFITMSASTDDDMQTVINSLISEYNKAYEAKDMTKMTSLFHPDSYSYKTMRSNGDYFDTSTAKITLNLLALIGMDKDIAVARVKSVVTSNLDSPPKVQSIDTIQVFRKHGEKWRFWDKLYLDVGEEKK